MNKWLIFAVLAVGAWFGATAANWMHDDPDAELLKQYETQVQINDSTSVVLAKERAEKRELRGLLLAAKQMNGRPVAGARARLELDTAGGTVEGSAQPIESAVERTWAFRQEAWKVRLDSAGGIRDSVKVGTLAASVLVRWPLTAQLTWQYAPEPLEPSVGLVKLADRYLVTVVCDACRKVTIEAPFADPKMGRADPRFVKTVAGQYDLVAGDWIGRAALDMRLYRSLAAGLEWRRPFVVGASAQYLAGIAVKF